MKYSSKYQIKAQTVADFPSVKAQTSQEAEQYLRDHWEHPINVQESFYALYLDRGNSIIGHALISLGSITATIVDNKILMKYAIDLLATAIIISHNHPSGQLIASEQDIKLTKKVQECCNLFDITLMDHIILTEDSSLSFAGECLL